MLEGYEGTAAVALTMLNNVILVSRIVSDYFAFVLPALLDG